MNYTLPNPFYRRWAAAIAGGMLLASLALAQQPAADDSTGDSTNAMLARSIEASRQQRSVMSKVRFSGRVLDQVFVGTGEYWQGPASSNVWRLELKLQLAGSTHSLQQICDGTTLWINRNRGKTTDVASVDLQRVRAALVAETAAADMPSGVMGLPDGGIPKLLENLQAAFQFQLVDPHRELYGVPMHVIEGTWKPEVLARLIPAAAGDSSKLPAHVPNRVVVFLGPDDHFPYRLEFHRDAGNWLQALDRTGPQEVVIEFYEVQFNALLQRSWFEFQPGSVPVADITAQWIQRRQKL